MSNSKHVIYNPNNIDAIFTAAVLQTYGWKAYAANEIIDQSEGKFYWVGVMPTYNHFPFIRRFSFGDRLLKLWNMIKGKKEVDTSEHRCFVKTARARNSEHLLLKNVIYRNTNIHQSRRDIYLRNDHSSSLLEQVCAVEAASTTKINSNEVHYLNYLIDDFYRKDQTVESLAMAVTNVLAALEALRTGEMFVPIRLPENRGVSPELLKAMEQVDRLKEKAKRVLNLGSNFQNTTTSRADLSRVVHTYEPGDWWFIRRYLRKNDIGLNVVVSATGSHIDATVDYKAIPGVPNPIVVIA